LDLDYKAHPYTDHVAKFRVAVDMDMDKSMDISMDISMCGY